MELSERMILTEALTPTESNIMVVREKAPTMEIVESLTEAQRILFEANDHGRALYLNGIYMQGGVYNRNNRKYPVTELVRETIKGKSIITESTCIYGELDHPSSDIVSLQNAAIAIIDMNMNGNDSYGKAKVLNSGNGQIIKNIIAEGFLVGVSSRATGQLDNDRVVRNMSFITTDVVATPSAKGAIPKPLYETLTHSKNGTAALALTEALDHKDLAAQKYLKKALYKFLEEGIIKRGKR
jgi:hypothetical protein